MLAKREISLSALPLFFADSSTSFNIRVAALSECSFVVFAMSVFSPFIIPESRFVPLIASIGTLSPVKADESTKELPLTTTQSSGILAKGLIVIIVPVFTSSAFTLVRTPSVFFMYAKSSLICDSFAISLRDFPTAMLSIFSPSANRTVTAQASTYSPKTTAAITAIVSRVVSSIFILIIDLNPFIKTL